jgi:hypothetical protein
VNRLDLLAVPALLIAGFLIGLAIMAKGWRK